MKVFLLSRYSRRGASSRVRFYQYLPTLHEAGIDCEVAPLFGDDYLESRYRGRWDVPQIVASYLQRIRKLRSAGRFDLAWIEYELLPWLPDAIEAHLWPDVPTVVEYDDAIFHRYDQHPSALVRALLGRKIQRLMRRVDLVIAGNDYLAGYAREAGARAVEIIPSGIDTNRYLPRKRRNDTPFTIGWIGSPTTAPYLDSIASILSELASAGSRVVVVGAGDTELEARGIERREWSEETEVDDLQTFDVGIMPMPDTPWERGKCGYKLIQSMGCGVPVIASPVGVNREIVGDGVNGYLVDSPDRWRSALERLREDSDLRERMGAAARATVESRYSVRVIAPRLIASLKAAGAIRQSCADSRES